MFRRKGQRAPVQHVHRVLLVADNAGGHRLSYIRLLADGARRQGRTVTIALSPDSRDAVNERVHFDGMAPEIEIVSVACGTLKDIENASRLVGADTTIQPDGDRFLRVLVRRGWRGAGRFRVLVMRPTGQSNRLVVRSAQTALKIALRDLAARRRSVDVFALASSIDSRDRPGWVRDPVSLAVSEDSIRQVRDTFELDYGTYWFGIIGAISDRKNIPMVVEAVSRLPGAVGILVAGKVSMSADSLDVALRPARDRGLPAIVIDRVLQDWEIDSLVAAVDCVVLAHSNDGPSGILGKAAAAGTVIAAAGAKSLRRDCALMPQSAVWSLLKPSDLASSFGKARELRGLSDGGGSPRHGDFAAKLLS